MSLFSRFKNGFSFVLSGFKASFQIPGLLKFAVIPFLLYLILVVSLGSYSLSLVEGWSADFILWIKSYFDYTGDNFVFKLIYKVAYVFMYIPMMVIGIYLLFILSTVIASPFNSLMAEKTLMHYGLIEDRPFSFSHWASVTAKMVMISLGRALILLIVGIGLFVFSLVPVLNIFVSFLVFIIIAFDCMDYSYELKELSLKQRFRTLTILLPEYLGMGSFLWLVTFIPGFSLIVLPFAVIGCSQLLHKVKLMQKSQEV